ncbi:MAG: PSD1 and planctomycete cytochrome C domain-containing protein [Verrucomicrobiota bacterium]|nr:PSD1 and planctomycete cytochrome C domain-containing protein [Verrucomicrobiota bacterium]
MKKLPKFRTMTNSRYDPFYWLACGYLLLFFGATLISLKAETMRFNRDIRPILAEHCLHCHGPDSDSRKGKLRLDLESDAKQHAIVEGDSKKSPLIKRVLTTDPEERMPPPEESSGLSEIEIQTLNRWIDEGAFYEKHWAFEPIRKPPTPDAGYDNWSSIDKFVLAELEASNLSMSPPVSRSKWIRRVTFDLTGLPPAWKEVEAYVFDPSPEAEEKVIDRLLESPRYGERWGRHWLDIARYADTHGGSAIGFTKFPFSYTYRDYVIGALNEDVPFDRFITEQLAADQLELPENDPSLAALGFLTIGQRFRSPHDIIDDRIDVITRGIMGLTVTCARCHDHKFDPIPTTDYYSLYATLASSSEPELLPVIGEPSETESYLAYEKKLQTLKIEYGDMAREQSEILKGRLRMQVGIYLKELARGTPEQDLSVSFLSFRTEDIRPHVLERWRDYLKQIPPNDPVFGPWKQLASFSNATFPTQRAALMEQWEKENGDISKLTPMENLSAKAPVWNPLILNAIKMSAPSSMEALAEAYGTLFAETHRDWTLAQVQSAEEALPDGTTIPDQDQRHRKINSAILRQLRSHLYADESPTALPEKLASQLLNRTVSDQLNGRRNAIHNLHLNEKGSPPRSMVLAENPDAEKKGFHVFRRGNPLNRGKRVQPRFLSVVGNGTAKHYPPRKQRLSLAQSITSESNPLTARVTVNWIWRHHFGRGLVRTPDDFGTRGARPTHLKFLDYLASTFVEDDWSIKKMHKRILLSKAYRQASVEDPKAREKDPDNQTIWRMPRHRLAMEAMRDAMLKVSGELNTTMNGRPFDMMTKPVVPRRSVYGFINRDVPSTLLTTFDGANPSACTAKRPETTVPQQTLFALNSNFIQDRAKALIQLPGIEEAKTEELKVRLLYQQTLSRLPEPEEIAMALEYVHDVTTESKSDRWHQLAHALLASNEFIFVD